MVSLPLLQASLLVFLAALASGSFVSDINLTWGGQRGKITENGELLTLSLDRSSGSGFQSKHEYLFGRIDMKMKLVPGNSAGTVTTLYLSSQGPTHDEIDFEFLGNVTGEPYVLHTNVYAQGKGNKEKQFYLWFDPRADFHTYSILWNTRQILFSVDNIPIRVFKNTEAQGVPFPKNQPMRLYSSLWDAEDWATRGGRVKTDWSVAPFTASYRGYAADDACVWANGRSVCSASTPWHDQVLDTVGVQKMKAVQDKYMIYDYCKDAPRFPQGMPVECSMAF